MGPNYQGLETLESRMSSEEISIDCYKGRVKEARDPELRALFARILKEEEAHLQMLEQLKRGAIPLITESKYGQHDSGRAKGNRPCNNWDARLCHDAMDGEKYSSVRYDELIFSIRDPAVRDVLNYIQSQEQNHGRLLCEYMDSRLIYC